MRELPPAARLYILGVSLAGPIALIAVAAADPVRPDLMTAAFIGLAAVAAARVIKLGARAHLGVSHPFIFAALLLQGPAIGAAVAVASILSSGFLKPQRMRPHQILFNFGVAVLSTIVAWLAYCEVLGLAPAAELEQAAAPVLVMSGAFFVVNSGLVSVAIGLSRRSSVWQVWRDSSLWSAPSFIAGGILGLLIVHFSRVVGTVTLLYAMPFCYLIYTSNRHYMGRMEEKRRRIVAIEQMNLELESKVRERTDELMQLNEQLRQASQHKSEFLSNMSHELRTPLSAILGYADLMLGGRVGPLQPRQEEFIADMRASGAHLKTLIDEILDHAKIEAGMMKLCRQRCDASSLVSEAVSMVQVLAANKSLDLVVEDDGKVGDITADPVRVRQILWNLLSNAIKFTPAGGRVGVSLTRDATQVRMAVWDTGTGIPADAIAELFEPFRQVDGSHSRQHEGTGLGLALVKRFVEMHGGVVDVSSERGRGSRFEIALPDGAAAAATGADTPVTAVA